MENQEAAQTSVASSVRTELEGLPEVDATMKAITDARLQCDVVLEQMKEQSQTATAKSEEIEQMWLLAERAKSELDSQIVPAREAVASLNQQVDAARGSIAELTRFSESLEATNGQMKAATDQATAALESLRTLATNGTDISNAAAAKCEEIERFRLHADRAKTEIDSQIVSAREAAAALNQQAESAKAQAVELKTHLESVKATDDETKESCAQAAAALESLRSLSTSASDNAARIEALRTQVEQAAQVAAQRSQHIEEGREYVDKKRAEIDVILNSALLSANNAEGHHQASQTIAEKLSSLYASAQVTMAATKSSADGVEKLLQECEEHSAVAKGLADVAETTEGRIATYEKRLTELEETAAERLRKIESLLPGAASAGLASAFNLRRQDFKWAPRIWQGTFIASILGLLVLAGLELYTNAQTGQSWEEMALSMVFRLPFALPLIWLAFHSSHKAALAERIEEDYGFKETVSRLFEGYRREMAELESKAVAGSALAQLCTEVLAVITNPPGRIYEKHRLNSTPINALAASAGPIAEATAKVVKPL
jgi:hypothetical protein